MHKCAGRRSFVRKPLLLDLGKFSVFPDRLQTGIDLLNKLLVSFSGDDAQIHGADQTFLNIYQILILGAGKVVLMHGVSGHGRVTALLFLKQKNQKER